MLRLLPAVFLVVSAYADTVFMKNGKQIEGIVTRETDTEVEVTVGAGTAVLPRPSVLRISRSSRAERKKFEEARKQELFEIGDLVPKGSESIFAAYQDLLRAHGRMGLAKSRKGKISKERDALRDRSPDLRGSGLEDAQSRLRELDDLLHLAQADLDEYASTFGRFRRRLRMLPDPSSPGERDFRGRLEAALRPLDLEFKDDDVRLERRGSVLVVRAKIDGVSARLILDTSAAYTTVSPKLAQRLRPLPEITAMRRRTLADGRRVSVRTMGVASVEVGRSKLERVVVDVLPAADPDVDGLLGLSFLSAFQVLLEGDRLRLSRLAASSPAAPAVFGGPELPPVAEIGGGISRRERVSAGSQPSDYHWSDDSPHNDRSRYPWVRRQCEDPDAEYARLDDGSEAPSEDALEIRGAGCDDIKSWNKEFKQQLVQECLEEKEYYGFVYRVRGVFYWDGTCSSYIVSKAPFFVDLRNCDRILVNPHCPKRPRRCYECQWGCGNAGECFPEPHRADCPSYCVYDCDYEGQCLPRPPPLVDEWRPPPRMPPPDEIPAGVSEVKVQDRPGAGNTPLSCPAGKMLQDGRCKDVQFKTNQNVR